MTLSNLLTAKATYLICLLTILPILASAQNEAEEEVLRIKADNDYIWGQGRSNSTLKADQLALNDLISKISVNVQSETHLDMSQVSEGFNRDSKSAVEAIVRTYSVGSLNNSKSIIVSEEPEAYVFRYIHKDELEKVFKEREDRIYSNINTAQSAEREGRIDDALRNYYWSYCLLKSLQHPNALKWKVDGKEHTLNVWIYEEINRILGNLKTEVAKIDGNRIDLMITYKGTPVTSIDFRYRNGMNYSNLTNAKDGITQIEMDSNAPADIHIRYEYEFRGMMSQDKELEMVMDVFNTTAFRKSKVVVPRGSEKEMKDVQAQFCEAVSTMGTALHAEAALNANHLAEASNKIVSAIKNRRYSDVKDCFTKEGYEMFDKLIHYGEAAILGEPVMQFYKLGKRVIARSIPMKFSFRNNSRTFIEDVTFTFNEEMKIESVAFGLDKTARNDIFNREAKGWTDSIRMVIATFLENYKTAFALKRLDYIKSIFDDDALIIVGHMVKKMQDNPENEKYLNNDAVKLTRLSKQQYIRNLERCFKSNQFVNVHFSDNDIKKMAKGANTFGILIHQDYYSSTYSDTGYLFLMVDLNNMDQPIIRVRTWQPKRDPNINGYLDKSDRYYGLIWGGNF